MDPAAASDSALRATRLMTSIFLVRDDRLLLLYRIGSSAVPESWVGIGGHVEPNEIREPTATILRELQEEVGFTADQISELALRHVALRDDMPPTASVASPTGSPRVDTTHF